MQIDRIFYPTKTLGPGNRIGIWTVGCKHNCLHCANPELWSDDPSRNLQLESLQGTVESIQKLHVIDGVTISGGEPFLQADELSELVLYLRNHITDDILIYSGFTIEELKTKGASVQSILQNIAVLVDGKYVDELNDNLPLRGSSNQRIHLLNQKYSEKYRELQNTGRTVQNIHYNNNLISFGIPMKDYRKTIAVGLENRGVYGD